MNTIFKGMVLCFPFLLMSCNDNNVLMIDENKTKVFFSVDKFESESATRTTIDPANNYAITWASGDIVGIFPREGYQEPFIIPADQIGKANASFDGGYWALKEGFTYNAYYPFDKINFESAEMKTEIPITYLGQRQNGTACGIGAYDYTYSDWTKSTNKTVNFKFHHIGAFAIFTLEYPATTTYTKLTLSSNSTVIPTTGTYDLTAKEVNFVADNSGLTNSISLSLDNCYATAGEKGVFYMMLPPMDVSESELTLTLTSSAGTNCIYSLEPFIVVKGKKYELTGEPVESKIEGTIDGWGEVHIPHNQIWYTSNDGNIVTPYNVSAFNDATIVRNEYIDGKGIITFDKKVTEIGAEAFYNCNGLSSVEIPSSVTLIKSESFSGCRGLNSIKIPSSVTSIGSSAFSMTGLMVVEIPSSVTIIGNSAFGYCDNLTSIEIPSSVKSIGEYAFSSCNNLESVNLPAFVDIEEGAFYCCPKLKTIELPLSKNIESFAFYGCKNLTTVNIPTSVKTIGQYAFSDCSALNTVSIPASVASIEEGAFRNCANLTSITIPSSVSSIGYDVFINTGLTDVYCEGTIPPTIKTSTFGDYSVRLYVPLSSLSTYQSTANWKKFTNIIPVNINGVYYGVLPVSLGIRSFDSITADMIVENLTKSPSTTLSKTAIPFYNAGDLVVVVVPKNRTATKDDGLGSKTEFYSSAKNPSTGIPICANGEVSVMIDGVEYYLYGEFMLLSSGTHYVYVD